MPVLQTKIAFVFHVVDATVADRHRQFAVPFLMAVDAVAVDGIDKTVDVFASQFLERFQVVGKEAQGIRQAVHHRSRDDGAGPT